MAGKGILITNGDLVASDRINAAWRSGFSALDAIVAIRLACLRSGIATMSRDEAKFRCGQFDVEALVYFGVLIDKGDRVEVAGMAEELERAAKKAAAASHARSMIGAKSARKKRKKTVHSTVVSTENNTEDSTAHSQIKYPEVAKKWAEVARSLGLAHLTILNRQRLTRLKELISELPGGEADVIEAIGYIHLNQYWKKEGSKYKAPGFDWFLYKSPSTCVKLLELGRSKGATPGKPKAITFAEQIAMTDAKFAAEKAEWEAKQAAKAEVGT